MQQTQRLKSMRQESMRQERLANLQRLNQRGIPGYPSVARRSHPVREVLEKFEELDGCVVTLAGRMLAKRDHGSVVFLNLSDETGNLQLLLQRHSLHPAEAGELAFEDLSLVNVGDVIEVTGTPILSKRGERSLAVRTYRLLAKTLRPLPDKWSGITKEEVRRSHRYLDLLMDRERRQPLYLVSKMLYSIREFLQREGFIEVQTPVLQPLYGGGNAKPFKTHLNALDADFYLSISHELYLKRLVVAGFERVFTIGRYFRNEGIDRTHNPEFSMLETMVAYENYEFSMDLLEDLYRHVAESLGRSEVSAGGCIVDLKAPWRRVSMRELIIEFVGIDVGTMNSVADLSEVMDRHGLLPASTWGACVLELFEHRVAPALVQPTLVYGHPTAVSPLAKAMADDPRFAERFELYIGGVEQGDNWTELNDPVELAQRFEAASNAKGGEAHPFDWDFIEAMEYGMPPTTGIGPGIERMAMLFSGSNSIADVMPFPLLRPKGSTPDEEPSSKKREDVEPA